MRVWTGFIRFKLPPAKGCYVHSTETSGSEITEQSDAYQYLNQRSDKCAEDDVTAENRLGGT
jgi:hypothetical protein